MKVYICHYEILTERKSYLDENLTKYFNNIEFVYGVSRDKIPSEEYSKFSNTQNSLDERLKYINCPNDYNIFLDSEKTVIANFLTHIEIWKKILESGDDYALVLEDDALLSDDFQVLWEKLINEMPDHFDIMYLHEGCGFSIINKLNITPTDKIWYDCHLKESRTCCSYLISKSFCKKLLENIYPIFLGVDFELNYLQKKLNSSVYWSYPVLFSEGSSSTYSSSHR
jgi:GR25 family glycosyltransferase involved in LPS biosynthesis